MCQECKFRTRRCGAYERHKGGTVHRTHVQARRGDERAQKMVQKRERDLAMATAEGRDVRPMLARTLAEQEVLRTKRRLQARGKRKRKSEASRAKLKAI